MLVSYGALILGDNTLARIARLSGIQCQQAIEEAGIALATEESWSSRGRFGTAISLELTHQFSTAEAADTWALTLAATLPAKADLVLTLTSGATLTLAGAVWESGAAPKACGLSATASLSLRGGKLTYAAAP